MNLRRIDSVEELRRYLQVALQLEHSTIPPYMTALYSIHPGTNPDSTQIIHTVVVEEMLHLVLVANMLNAIGGSPDFTLPGFVPLYPAHLPDGETDFEVGIRPFSRAAIETFLQIERPGAASEEIDFIQRARSPLALLPGFGDSDASDMHFYSIGEFYAEIDRGLHWLHAEMTARGEVLFTGDPTRQVTPSFRYSGGGEILAVYDLASADAAIRLICEQGEGLGGRIYDEEDELSHYYQFEQVLLGRYYQSGDLPGQPSGATFDVDWFAVYPVRTNARLTDYPEGCETYNAACEFNIAYQDFLALLTRAHNGEPELLETAVGVMYQLKDLVSKLIVTPIPGLPDEHGVPVYGAVI